MGQQITVGHAQRHTRFSRTVGNTDENARPGREARIGGSAPNDILLISQRAAVLPVLQRPFEAERGVAASGRPFSTAGFRLRQRRAVVLRTMSLDGYRPGTRPAACGNDKIQLPVDVSYTSRDKACQRRLFSGICALCL